MSWLATRAAGSGFSAIDWTCSTHMYVSCTKRPIDIGIGPSSILRGKVPEPPIALCNVKKQQQARLSRARGLSGRPMALPELARTVLLVLTAAQASGAVSSYSGRFEIKLLSSQRSSLAYRVMEKPSHYCLKYSNLTGHEKELYYPAQHTSYSSGCSDQLNRFPHLDWCRKC